MKKVKKTHRYLRYMNQGESIGTSRLFYFVSKKIVVAKTHRCKNAPTKNAPLKKRTCKKRTPQIMHLQKTHLQKMHLEKNINPYI